MNWSNWHPPLCDEIVVQSRAGSRLAVRRAIGGPAPLVGRLFLTEESPSGAGTAVTFTNADETRIVELDIGAHEHRDAEGESPDHHWRVVAGECESAIQSVRFTDEKSRLDDNVSVSFYDELWLCTLPWGQAAAFELICQTGTVSVEVDPHED